MLNKFSTLDKFNKGKVTILFNTEGNTGVTYTYRSFVWYEDAGYLVLGDTKNTNEDVTTIDIDEIEDIVVDDNLNSIELILTHGNIFLILDEYVSLCCKCKRNRPVFYIRDYGTKSDEYDVRVCQTCFEKMMDIKI
jgi:hypothetical protein